MKPEFESPRRVFGIRRSSRDLAFIATSTPALAAAEGAARLIDVGGIPIDFILFAMTLLGVALFHKRALQVALTGLAAITGYKLIFTGFKFGFGLTGLASHMAHEWVTLSPIFLPAYGLCAFVPAF